jgi:MarR family 2-MHQ and catechol resistance regulon transcriptional repressor
MSISPSQIASALSDPPTATALKLWVVLNRAVEAIRLHAKADIARHDLSEGEFAILETLYHKGRLTLGDVQKKVLVTSGGTTFLVDKLQKRGLVRRAPCETDRRSTWAELTPAGHTLVTKIFPAHAEVIRRALSGLGLADQRKVTALLKTLGTEAAALEPLER